MSINTTALYPKRSLASGSPVASQSLSVSTTAVAPTGYTASTAGFGGVQLVTFDVQGATVRARWDGTDPTASVGHVLSSGASYTWDVSQFNACKFIRQDATNATIFSSPMSI